MHTQPQPDPDDVARGMAMIYRELQRSLIVLKPAATIRAILRLLDSAHAVLSQPIADMDPYRQAAGVAVALVDGCRRELAVLGSGGDR
jgi:hypothetical protein